MQFSMMESVIMDKSSHGGVVNLLRMAKTQCGAAIAFAAIRKADGHFAIATFPSLGRESPWSIEAVDELVHQAWADPHLTGGKVLVRAGRVVSGAWPGEDGAVKLAVAPLSDLGSLDRPWGLLCVADPMTGQFAQERLDLLGTMAVRLTSYLRARQEVLDDGSPDVAGERPAPSEGSLPWPLDEDHVARAEAAGLGTIDTEDSFEALLRRKSGVIDEIFNGGAFEGAFSSSSGAETDASWASVGRAEPVAPVRPTEPEAPVRALWEPGEGPAVGGETPAPRPEATVDTAAPPAPPVGIPGADVSGAGGPAADLGSMLRPDPVTGLVGLPSLLGQLGSTLGALPSSGGSVAVVLVEVTDPTRAGQVTDDVLASVAARLREHLRGGDMVARVGHSTFGVVATLRTGPVDAPIIEQRLVEAVRSLLVSVSGDLAVRTALATGTPDGTTGPEDLLRHVAAQLALV